MYYQRPGPLPAKEASGLTLEQRAQRNKKDKEALVAQGKAHGVLVYAGDEPVGWCQFGPKQETPRIDAMRRYKALDLGDRSSRLWRISCFSVDRAYRKKGVAGLALSAALDAIAERGGGLVEAYPAARKGALAMWFGTVSMFERKGFKVVAPFGRSNVLMRMGVSRRRRRSG